jgi:hypothetical protein
MPLSSLAQTVIDCTISCLHPAEYRNLKNILAGLNEQLSQTMQPKAVARISPQTGLNAVAIPVPPKA